MNSVLDRLQVNLTQLFTSSQLAAENHQLPFPTNITFLYSIESLSRTYTIPARPKVANFTLLGHPLSDKQPTMKPAVVLCILITCYIIEVASNVSYAVIFNAQARITSVRFTS